MPAEPVKENAREPPSRIHARNLAGPNDRENRMIIGRIKARRMRNPSQKVEAGDRSMRVCARCTRFGNNSHHAASMDGNAILRINRIKKMAEMSAMGISFLLMDTRDTEELVEKLQVLPSTSRKSARR